MKSMKRRCFLDWLLRRPQRVDVTHAMFLERCADGDMAVRFGRPDIYVADLERIVSLGV